jgi:hypothetical protein
MHDVSQPTTLPIFSSLGISFNLTKQQEQLTPSNTKHLRSLTKHNKVIGRVGLKRGDTRDYSFQCRHLAT